MKVKIEYSFECGKVGAGREDWKFIDVPDDYTDEQIEEAAEQAAKDWMWDFVDLGFKTTIQWTKKD